VDISLVWQKVAISLGLGLLVGLQRERVQSPLAGIRTFALITVLGTVCALLGLTFGGWVVGLGGLTVAAMLGVGNLAQGKAGELETGVTTEIAAVLMYGVGAYLVIGHAAVAIAIGGGVALLLHWKTPLHEFVSRIGETDLKAIMQFVLVALVIYPVLPDEPFGPYGVLNPQQIWFMVVLIVGINLGGYVAYKLFGQRSGAALAGVLGGLISSTATTVSYSRRARQDRNDSQLAALVIVIASAVAYARVLAEVAVVAPNIFAHAALPLAIMFVWMVIAATTMYWMSRLERTEPSNEEMMTAASAIPNGTPTPCVEAEPLVRENPAELKPALFFTGLYALMLVGVATTREHLGSGGLYGVAFLSGLHDLDAITLSTARFMDQGQVETDLGWRLILTASLANLTVKGAVTAILGQRRLLRSIAVPFGGALLVGAALLLLWPDLR